jgi:hypothetical protein
MIDLNLLIGFVFGFLLGMCRMSLYYQNKKQDKEIEE